MGTRPVGPDEAIQEGDFAGVGFAARSIGMTPNQFFAKNPVMKGISFTTNRPPEQPAVEKEWINPWE